MDLFNSIITKKPKKSRFVLNHEYCATMDLGFIYPFLCMDCVPGDRFRFGNEVLVNTATMSSPVYGRIDARVDYFFVPYRLLWDDWKDFITGGEDGQQAPTFPMIQLANDDRIAVGSIFDYMGIPPTVQFGVNQYFDDVEGEFSSLPFRAYNFIWNEFYRNQNYQDEVPFRTTSDTTDELADYKLLSRCWRPDYYTSMLPTPQRGADVQIPVTGEGSMYADIPLVNQELPEDLEGAASKTSKLRGATYFEEEGIRTSTFESDASLYKSAQNRAVPYSKDDLSATQPYGQVDVSSHTRAQGKIEGNITGLGVSINDLRRANAVQVWLERNMRAGARYVEQILSHFGVRVPDYRLDRPEHIGGFTKPIQVNQMQQLSQTTEDSYLGELGGRGFMYGQGSTRKYRVEEHGVILGLINLQPRAMYSQGLPRYFSKKDKFEFYFPEFANLGEQDVKVKEFFQPFNTEHAEETAGYLPRYSEYKYIPSSIHGGFLTQGLEHWTMSRFFRSVPYLDENSVKVTPNTDDINRIWNQTNTPDEDDDTHGYGHFYVRLANYVNGKRPMPRYGTPKLIG